MINSKKKGFTIVELVIVIAVIAILAAVLIPTFSSLVKKANLSADQQAVRQMNTALAIAGNPSDIDAAIDALAEAGYNSKENLQPVSTGYSFYWYESAKVVVLVKDTTVVYPEGVEYEANGVLLENSVQYINVEANNEDALKDAFINGNEEIKLSNDVTLSSDLILNNGADITIDLNNKTLEITGFRPQGVNQHHYGITIYDGTIKITNGTIKGRGALQAIGSDVEVIIENVTFEAIDNDGGSAVWVQDGANVTINSGTFKAGKSGGINDGSAYGPTAITNKGGNVTINGGTFIGTTSYAINNNSGTMTINNATVNAERGCVACIGGTLTINGGTFEKTGSGTSSHIVYAGKDLENGTTGTINIKAGSFNCDYLDETTIRSFCEDGGNIEVATDGNVKVNGVAKTN